MKPLEKWLGKLPDLLKKYKYPALILFLGILLMLLPVGKKAETAAEPVRTEPTEAADPWADYCGRTERRLEAILSRIDGAGKVSVMLSLRSGQAAEYQTDRESRSVTDGERQELEESEKTVIFSRGSAYNEPAVVKTDYPVFLGALVVAQGGDDPGVRLALTNAVAALLGLGTDQITIVKMK